MKSLTAIDKFHIEHTQADLVLAILKFKGSVTTSQLVGLGIKSPSTVVCRLRNDGYMIDTVFITRSSFLSKSQAREAKYTLTFDWQNARIPF